MSVYGPRCTCREPNAECRLHQWPTGALLIIGTGRCLLCEQPLDAHSELMKNLPACPRGAKEAA